jgi:hypothetical protein
MVSRCVLIVTEKLERLNQMNNPVLNSESFERAAYSLSREMERFGRSGFTDDVSRFHQSVEQFRESVSKLAAVLGMQAENDQRKVLGHSMAYTDGDFADYQ